MLLALLEGKKRKDVSKKANEPIGNLDSKSGKEILELLQKINKDKGITILMVTHSEESTHYGKKVIRLKDGEIVGAAAVQALPA